MSENKPQTIIESVNNDPFFGGESVLLTTERGYYDTNANKLHICFTRRDYNGSPPHNEVNIDMIQNEEIGNSLSLVISYEEFEILLANLQMKFDQMRKPKNKESFWQKLIK